MLKWKSILCTRSKEVNVHSWEVREGLAILEGEKGGEGSINERECARHSVAEGIRPYSRADHRVFCSGSRARIYISVPGTKSRGSFHLYFHR